MIMIMLNTFTPYIFHKLSSYKGANKCQIRDAINIQRFVFYIDTYTCTLRVKFLGTFTQVLVQHVRVLIAKFYFLLIQQNESLRTETELRFWRKKLGECIQREITLIIQHSKTRYSFASICIFSFFLKFYSLFKYKTN